MKDVGAVILDDKDKVELPVFMGSMNKKTEKDVNNWIKKYPGDVIISDKLDGISFLLTIERKVIQNKLDNLKLYTRGNGYEGKDITKFIKYLTHNFKTNYFQDINKDLKTDMIILRGEMIISKSNYKKIKDKSSNARSFISGLSNLKEIKGNKLEYMKYVDLVFYELIEPKMKPLEQYKLIKDLSLNCVEYKNKKQLSYSELDKYLIERKDKSDYEIDGIIINENKIHNRKFENPKHSFAYKKDLEFAITKVIEVEWNVSKLGKLKPIVKIEPVNLNGTINSACTGNNGEFIYKNKIGKGAIVKIIKGGEIIPKIEEVLEPAIKGDMPENLEYIWNDSKKEILIQNFDNHEYKLKKLIIFFKSIGVENIGPGIFTKLYKNGFNTIEKICKIKKNELMNLEGIKEKSSDNIYRNIHNIIDKDIDIIKIIVGSCIYSGIGEKILVKILNKFPNFFISNNTNVTKEDLIEIETIQEKTAIKILYNLPLIKEFILKLHFLKIKNYKKKSKLRVKKFLLFNAKKIVMTGFRDNDIIKFIENNGIIQNSVNKSTNMLIYKVDNGSTKIKKAVELDISKCSLEEFKNKYKM